MFTVPTDGTYQIELWGASGGDGFGNNDLESGKGGYVSGEIKLTKNTKLYVYVGEQGKIGTSGHDSTKIVGQGAPATFNGGGAGGNAGGGSQYPYSWYRGGPSGGGATDIRLVAGNWDFFDSLKSRIMVAGGGGGYANNPFSFIESKFSGGNNLGLIGENGSGVSKYNNYDYDFTDKRGQGATQTTGYHFGYGGLGNNSGNTELCYGNAGGGGGYYGGTGALDTGGYCFIIGGGAGSSFISGYEGCNAISKDSTEEQIIHTDQPNHYSGYTFTNANMIAGTSSMPTHDGNSTMIGNNGNGYAKITFIK